MKKVLSLLFAVCMIITLFSGIGTVGAEEDKNGNYLVAKRSRPFLLGNGNAVGDAIDSGYATISDNGWRPGTTQAYWVVGKSVEPNTDECLSMCLKSDVAEGEGPNNATPFTNVTTYFTVDPTIGAFMFYIESPTLAPNKSWALRFDTYWATQNGKNAWGRFYNMKVKYLAVDGKDWVTTYTDENESLILPNGFKGYIKCYMNDCAQDAAGNQTAYQHLTNDCGYDMSRSFSINTIGFLFGSLGGEYGDFVIGSMYSLERDSDNTYGCLYDWYNSNSSTPNRMTTYQPALRLRRSSTQVLPGNGYAVGDPVNDGNMISVSDMGWRSGKSQATVSVGPAAEPETGNYTLVVHSDVAEGQGPNNASPSVNFRSYLTVDSSDALMFYMESPTRDESSDISYILRINTCWCSLNGANKWGHLYNMKIAYLANGSEEWVQSSTDWNETLLLPSGFKGYVKFYLDTAMQNESTTFYQSIGYTNPSDQTLVFNSFDLVFGWLGGEYGDLVFGGGYAVTEDGNTLYADITDKNGLNAARYNLVKLPAAMGDLNGDGSFDATDLLVLRKHLLGCTTRINLQKADVNGDEKIDIKDLIALKKQMVEAFGTVYRKTPLDSTLLKPVGRTEIGEPTDLIWNLSGFEFSFRGSAARVKLAATCTDTANCTWVAVEVNGVRQNKFCLRAGEYWYDLITDAEPDAITNIRLLKLTETKRGICTVTGLETDGTLETRPAEKDLLIEVIGDSISTGYGVLGSGSDSAFVSEYQDPSYSYGALLAKDLDADLLLTAVSGSGVYENNDYTTATVMPDYYEMAKPFVDPSVSWDHSAYDPDLIVINLGTNDSSVGADLASVGQAVKDFTARLKMLHPNAKIIWCYGMMYPQSAYADCISAAVNEIDDSDVIYVQLPDQFTFSSTTGTHGHPGVAAQAGAEAVLLPYAKQLLGID